MWKYIPLGSRSETWRVLAKKGNSSKELSTIRFTDTNQARPPDGTEARVTWRKAGRGWEGGLTVLVSQLSDV